MAVNAIASVATALAGGAYLNAKFGIGMDMSRIRQDNSFGARLTKRIQDAGSNCTMYGLFSAVDPTLELLWFEGKAWTYGQIKAGESDSFRLMSSKTNVEQRSIGLRGFWSKLESGRVTL